MFRPIFAPIAVSEVRAIGLQTQGPIEWALDALPFPIDLTMPCGERVIWESREDVPRVDTPCRCGNERHWFVRHSQQ